MAAEIIGYPQVNFAINGLNLGKERLEQLLENFQKKNVVEAIDVGLLRNIVASEMKKYAREDVTVQKLAELVDIYSESSNCIIIGKLACIISKFATVDDAVLRIFDEGSAFYEGINYIKPTILRNGMFYNHIICGSQLRQPVPGRFHCNACNCMVTGKVAQQQYHDVKLD